ncbi:hypothetical protein [Persicobacter psychrovividus]|uniref:Uncharacterized protein n=1 Tax=Persicobacter psychrovividus TaxID=387638 RepID=A0ABM7VB81_9BACT|nr:hypothetical protein PEPS_04600 [Persicobacter psychrovividus]
MTAEAFLNYTICQQCDVLWEKSELLFMQLRDQCVCQLFLLYDFFVEVSFQQGGYLISSIAAYDASTVAEEYWDQIG